jgi:glycosyltransferase involved in cell wall biosynthesis
MSDANWPTRILHLIAPAHSGGAESVVRGLALAGAGQGLQPTVAALLQDNAPSPFVEQLRRDGTQVHEVRCGRRRYLTEARVVERIATECATEVIHTHVYHADLVGYLAARRRRVPVVATVHGFTGGGWKNRTYEWGDRKLLGRFDGLICVSEPVRDLLLASGARPDHLYLIPNGYEGSEPIDRMQARHRLGLEPGGHTVGWVGRLSQEKGPDLFVKAMADAGLTDVTGVLIGDGPELRTLASQAKSAGLSNGRLRLVGRRDDAAALMRAFDLIVLSSRTEGTPMALLEAMSAGVPVVAFGVGGIPQVLDQASGWLVPAEDTAALATAIRNALADPAEATRRAMRAQEVVRNEFGVTRWIERIREVYAVARAR